MKIKLHRADDSIECKQIYVYINDVKYTISKSIDDKLCINKVGYSLSENINIHPRYANEIEIS